MRCRSGNLLTYEVPGKREPAPTGARKKSVFLALYLYATATTSTPSMVHVAVSQHPLRAVSISFASRSWGKPAWYFLTQAMMAMPFLAA